MGIRHLPVVIKSRGLGGTLEYLSRSARFFFNRHLTRKKHIECTIWDGEYSLLLDLKDNGISRALAINGRREMQLKEILEEFVQPGMCVFDLGANIGYYAIWQALKVGPEGKVYCIEPSPGNFDLLNKNVELNNVQNWVETFNVGAADHVGEMDFFLAEYSNLHTFLPEQFRCGDKSRRLLEGSTIKVPVSTVSEFAKGKKQIDLIRMDVEGFEVEVLIGMQKECDNNPDFKPIVVFETHFPKYDDTEHSMRDALHKMFDRGYRIAIVSSNDEKKNKQLTDMGYRPYKLVNTSDTQIQGLYCDIKNEDGERLICDIGGVRDVVLKKD